MSPWTAICSLPWLLAQRSRWERLGDSFSGEEAELSSQEILLLIAMAVCALLGLWLLRRLAGEQSLLAARDRPKRLFRDLCRAHQLSRTERAALRQFGESHFPDDAARIFLAPELFEGRHLPPDGLLTEKWLSAMRARLFGDGAGT